MVDACWAIRLIEALAMPGVALWGVYVAREKLALTLQQYRAANKTRMEEQFVRGARLLDYRDSDYAGRTAGAATLADLALEKSDEYDERVMRVFQAFLDFPPRYGKNHRKEGQVDYTSHDTVAITDAIKRRKPRERDKYTIRLRERSPFSVNAAGDVEENPDYDDPAKRPSRRKRMNEWEQDTLNRIIRKLGPDFSKCLKCGHDEGFQTWPVPHYLIAEGTRGFSLPYEGEPGKGLFVKACRACGFVELYCPDAIESDE